MLTRRIVTRSGNPGKHGAAGAKKVCCCNGVAAFAHGVHGKAVRLVN
jgi:hypothetical protein